MKTKVQPIIDPEELKRDVSFSDTRITESFMDQAALYVDYAQKCQQAEMQADRFKQAAEIIEAKAYKEIRDDLVSGKEKFTEAQISKDLAIDSRVIAAKRLYNEAKSIHSMCKSALEAIKQRKDMLIQCGADLREEHKGQLRMHGPSTADRSATTKERIQEAMQR